LASYTSIRITITNKDETKTIPIRKIVKKFYQILIKESVGGILV
jgi:hypothetical protein